MPIPKYITYSDFVSNYEFDFLHSRSEYIDLTEVEYLKEVRRDYKELIEFAQQKIVCYNEKTETENEVRYELIEIHLFSYSLLIESKYGNYLRVLQSNVDELEKNHPEGDYEICRNYHVPPLDVLTNLIYFVDKDSKWDISEHLFYLKFLKFEGRRIIEDNEKVKQFSYSLTRILNFINEKIHSQTSTNIISESVPEVDFSDNADKVKLIMLEKLGVIDYIRKIQMHPDKILHTSEILSSFTGISSKTLNSYLNPMLQSYRNDNDKNSPYKNQDNVEKAERELVKLKIKNIDANL